MRKATVLLTALVALLVLALPVGAITNGDLDDDGHPYVGLMIADIDGEPQWRCTGTLISPVVFLTAGHCVGDGATGARVWFDADLTDNLEYPYGGATSVEGTPIPHPLYAFPNYDVGVILLDEPVTNLDEFGLLPELTEPGLLDQLKKARVLEGNYRHKDGVFFTSVGYGGTLADWPPPELEYDRVRRVVESEYVALTDNWLHVSQKAVFDEGGTCFGDSGGPSFYVDGDKEIIVTVTSTGDAQCIATGLNFRVDTPEVLGWIYDQLEYAESHP